MKDLTGQRFGRLLVIGKTEMRGPDGGMIYECKCDCGNICLVWNNKLTRKNHSAKRSCGCLQEETHTTYIHGGAKTILFHKWRGISICDEWLNSFESFRDWANSNGYEEYLSIERIDSNGNYCPENCRWITMADQQKNKRNVELFTMNGETHTIPEWAEITGIKYGTLWKRIKINGMSIEQATKQHTRTALAGRAHRNRPTKSNCRRQSP